MASFRHTEMQLTSKDRVETNEWSDRQTDRQTDVTDSFTFTDMFTDSITSKNISFLRY